MALCLCTLYGVVYIACAGLQRSARALLYYGSRVYEKIETDRLVVQLGFWTPERLKEKQTCWISTAWKLANKRKH